MTEQVKATDSREDPLRARIDELEYFLGLSEEKRDAATKRIAALEESLLVARGHAHGTSECPICGKDEPHTHPEYFSVGLPIAKLLGGFQSLHAVAAICGKYILEREKTLRAERDKLTVELQKVRNAHHIESHRADKAEAALTRGLDLYDKGAGNQYFEEWFEEVRAALKGER